MRSPRIISLKALDTFGNCQRSVFSIANVYSIIYIRIMKEKNNPGCKSLWSFRCLIKSVSMQPASILIHLIIFFISSFLTQLVWWWTIRSSCRWESHSYWAWGSGLRQASVRRNTPHAWKTHPSSRPQGKHFLQLFLTLLSVKKNVSVCCPAIQSPWLSKENAI